MKKEVIYNINASEPGSYSQAIKCGNLIFVSGQTSENPVTNEVFNGSVAEQTECILKNIRPILNEAGSGLDKVLKCSVFLSSMNKFEEMNEVYRKFFPSDPSARVTVAVKGIDANLDVEVEVIAGVV